MFTQGENNAVILNRFVKYLLIWKVIWLHQLPNKFRINFESAYVIVTQFWCLHRRQSAVHNYGCVLIKARPTSCNSLSSCKKSSIKSFRSLSFRTYIKEIFCWSFNCRLQLTLVLIWLIAHNSSLIWRMKGLTPMCSFGLRSIFCFWSIAITVSLLKVEITKNGSQYFSYAHSGNKVFCSTTCSHFVF